MRRQASSNTDRPLRRAVVLGGSVAGLLAARVLADHFAHVTVIERDTLRAAPDARKGVPQGNHLHALLARGRFIAETLLPGLSEELTTAGAVRVNSGRDFAWYDAGGWRVRYDSDLTLLSMSRPLLESRIAGKVHDLPNVTFLAGMRTIGLLCKADAITGVRVARPGRREESHEIGADLVVDATGRASATPQWLEELGFPAPRTELVGASVTYVTCTFPRADQRPEWQALIISGKPARRSGLIFAIEDDRWLVTLPGFFDEPMPQSHDGFLEYARSLAVPDIYATIRDREPLSEVKRYRFLGSRRRRYEQLRRFPQGLIVIGDAVCSFNPVYGQGMTVAAIEAQALGEALAGATAAGGIGPDFAGDWFGRIKPIVDAAWNAVRLEDFRFPELAHARPLHLRPQQWYMDRVQRATHHSAFVTDRFYRVMNFLDPPTKLFSPRMLAEVLFAGNGHSRRTTASAVHRSPETPGPAEQVRG